MHGGPEYGAPAGNRFVSRSRDEVVFRLDFFFNADAGIGFRCANNSARHRHTTGRADDESNAESGDCYFTFTTFYSEVCEEDEKLFGFESFLNNS